MLLAYAIISLWLNHNIYKERRIKGMAISLKAARINAELTLDDVYKATGIHPNSLSKYESYESKVDINRAIVLCDLYGCAVDDIKWSKE